MPVAGSTKPGKRRPSASARSESGLSSMSFRTAADNAGTATEESGDDEDGEYENDPDYLPDSQPHQDNALDPAPVSRSVGTPGLTMSSDEDDGNKSGDTLNKTPTTEKDEGELATPIVAASTPVTTRKALAVAATPLSPMGAASKRMSRITSANSSMDAGSEYNSSRRTYHDSLGSRRDDRLRSQSERGTSGNKVSRNNRTLLPSNDFPRRLGPPSSRGSFQSERRGPASVSDYHGSNRSSYMRSLPTRRHDDNLSIASRRSRATSTTSRLLDSESQVFAGTRIRRYIEPSLTDAMRRVMKQFSASGAAHLDDHRCIGYPIAVFVGATAIDVGSIINPIISGAVALYFAPGHPKNMAALLPSEDHVPAHIPNPKAPNTTSLSRRAELRSAITALHTVYELYRGRACAHVCIDSAYVAKAWGTWIPTWEAEGWPGLDEEDYSDRERWEDDYYERDDRRRRSRRAGRDGERNRSRRGYHSRDDRRRHDDDNYSSEEEFLRDQRRRRRGDDSYDESEDGLRSPRRPMNRAPGRRLVDEDLMRELADIRYDFGRIERERLGSAHVYLLDRSHNPADKMARAVARNEAQMAQQLGSEAEAIGLDIDDADLSDPEHDDMWADTRSRMSKNSRLTNTSATRSKSARNSTRGSGANGTRNSITSNATSHRLRNSASAPAVRGQPRRQLDTFAEEDEYNLSNESAGIAGLGSGSRLDLPATGAETRSLRSDKSKRSTRAERERDEYLARQLEEREEEAAAAQQSSRQSRDLPRSVLKSGSRLLGLQTTASDRGMGAGRRSMDVESTSRRTVDVDPRRTSLDSRRRTSISQPDLRNRFASQPPSEMVRGALASAATRDSRRSLQLPEDRHRSLRGSASAHGHGSRNAYRDRDFDEEDDFEPSHHRAAGTASRASRLGRSSKQSIVLADPPAVLNRKLASRSTPSLHRTPAPEDDDYDWSRSPRKPTAPKPSRTPTKSKKNRQWHSTAPEDLLDDEDQQPTLRKKKSFFTRLFSRKNKS